MFFIQNRFAQNNLVDHIPNTFSPFAFPPLHTKQPERYEKVFNILLVDTKTCIIQHLYLQHANIRHTM